MYGFGRLNALLYAVAIGMLAVLFGVIGFALLYRSRLDYQINYNEGWNSYFTARVLDGLPLYPARSSRLINNYPPLSFYMAALMAKLTGSVLVAGRALAWSGFAGSATLIGLILRRMGCSAAGASFGALFFGAVLVTRCDLYVGMFDPQLFAQMLMLAGCLVALSRPDSAGAVAAAALIVAGGFVKHSLLALPVSLTLWLAFYRRRLLLPWLLTGAGLAGAGLAASVAGFGPEFIAGLSLPRQTSLSGAVGKMLRWLLPLELPCALATLPAVLVRVRRDDSTARHPSDRAYAAFVLIYVLVALAIGLAGAAPLGTNYNMIFELLVAVSLGLGLLVGWPGLRIPPGWVALASAVSLWVTALQLGTAETSSWRAWSSEQRSREANALAAVALIRAAPGDALCGTLLLCFQSGKPMLYDPLNYGQAPGESQADLQRDLAGHRFGLVQIDSANLYLTDATMRVLLASYREIPDRPGLFVPFP